MSDMDDVKKLAENVSSLQKDMAQVGALVDRLDITIEKLTEVSTTVSQLLAVQGNRLEFQEKVAEKLQDLVEKRRQETDNAVKEIYVRIEKVEADMYADMKNSENSILKEIKDMRNEGATQHTTINDRMSRLEKWMWTIMGGGIIIGFIISNLPWDKLF